MNQELFHTGKRGMKWGRRKAHTHGTPHQNKPRQNNKLSSPGTVLKNMNKYSDKDLERVVGRLKMQQSLRQLNNDNRQKASKYANTILAYGTTMATAYGLYKSPLGQKIKDMIIKVTRRGAEVV